MNTHWTDVRTQLDQVLTRERMRRQTRHRQQSSVWQRLRQGWASAVRLAQGRRAAVSVALTITPQRYCEKFNASTHNL